MESEFKLATARSVEEWLKVMDDLNEIFETFTSVWSTPGWRDNLLRGWKRNWLGLATANCEERAEELYNLFLGYLEQNQVKFCAVAVVNYRVHAFVAARFRYYDDAGELIDGCRVFDPWFKIKVEDFPCSLVDSFILDGYGWIN